MYSQVVDYEYSTVLLLYRVQSETNVALLVNYEYQCTTTCELQVLLLLYQYVLVLPTAVGSSS